MLKGQMKMFLGLRKVPSIYSVFLICFLLHLTGRNEATFQCFQENEINSLNQRPILMPIGLQVTNRSVHQVMTRIFSIFLKEILNYKDVRIVPIQFENPYDSDNSWYAMDSIRSYKGLTNVNMINLEIWVPYGYIRLPEDILNAGPSIAPGRFSWYVPSAQLPKNVSDSSLSYKVFHDINNVHYGLYLMDDKITESLTNISIDKFMNPNCNNRKCVTLLAEFRSDTYFIENYLRDSYVNVLWLGAKFQDTIQTLVDTYKREYGDRRRFIVLHWQPSELINGSVKFKQIILPLCEDYVYLQDSSCRYEMTPILKYYSKKLDSDKRLIYALRRFFMTDFDLAYIQRELGYSRNYIPEPEQLYDEVACTWMKTNATVFPKWIQQPIEEEQILSIGGIFPINVTTRGHINITYAAEMAVEDVNNNKTILPGYILNLKTNNGGCKSDMVMKAFIHYYNTPNMLGVLGPACSETVEPIAGLSRHLNMMVMSYSAEGASFVDRVSYPYFFRTIGSNTEYVDAYMEMMRQLGWNRVSTLTEDGQQYMNYMAYMESELKRNNFTLAFNRKFQTNVSSEDMNEHLCKLRQAHSRIIIAELHNDNVAVALCEAIKLKMTQEQNYVWFLPSWIPKDLANWQQKVKNRCTAKEFQKAIEGHLSIRHTPFGKPRDKMPEGQTIESWLSSYRREHNTLSNYVGFVYDAVWAYAIAAHRLLSDHTYTMNTLRSTKTVNRLTDLIWETDFNGLSGKVMFGRGQFGGSRISTLDILKWRNMSYVEVGKFKPNVQGTGSEMHINGGDLSFNAGQVFNGEVPEDGRYDCRFSGLARALHVNCEVSELIFSIAVCLAAIVLMSLISFYFWKQRYNRKVKQSAQIMKMFGIDLITPSRNKINTLDKWELPKDSVVINRRIGEGAFGTVYGGEAQIGSGGWTAVAVKTLKSGGTTEDRIDFLAEAEAMKKFAHKNIIKLLGVCLQSEPIYTIMEFMLYGDLKTYLLARRNMVNEKINDESDISAKRLTMYAMDVARGLAYLAEQKYVHRDIACRNCLVNSQRVIKIGDFGMARPTFESDYYCFNRKGVRKLFPVRWMPPETLSLGVFTSSSDIWSFGIVLYEIISFGSYPYQGLTNNQVLDYVKAGNTLTIPSGVKPPLEGLLKSCWSQDATKRPTASEVIDYISCYPRLLAPCLDCPGASVQMPETESDEMELLPPGRRCHPLARNSSLDILSPINSSTNLQKQFHFPSHENLSTGFSSNTESGIPSLPVSSDSSFSPITPDGYSIMSPLISHQKSITNES